MKLDRLSAIAEIVGAVAIVLTLGYLAIQTSQISDQTEQLTEQTRQNTAALLSSARQESLNAELGLLYQTLEHGIIGNSTPPTERQRESMRLIVIAMIRIRENLWWQYRSGVLDEDTWLTYQSVLLQAIENQPSNQAIWKELKEEGSLDTSFVNEIDSLLEIDD